MLPDHFGGAGLDLEAARAPTVLNDTRKAITASFGFDFLSPYTDLRKFLDKSVPSI
jgi:hypothetical protein